MTITPPRPLTTNDVTAHGGAVDDEGCIAFINLKHLNHAIASTQASQWIDVATKPEEQAPVLVISAGRVLRAMWVPRFTREDNGATDDFGEYNEADDEYYWPEGWYEWNHCDEVHWRLEGASEPTHWAPLPLPGEVVLVSDLSRQDLEPLEPLPLWRGRGWWTK